MDKFFPPKTKVNLDYERKVRCRLDYIYNSIARGVPITTICLNLGINRSQWTSFFRQYQEFYQIVTEAEVARNEAVENALYRKAIGGTTTEMEVRETVTDSGVVVSKTVKTKQFQPDTGAATFILKNRQPERWKDIQKVSYDGEVKMNVTLPIPPPNEVELIEGDDID